MQEHILPIDNFVGLSPFSNEYRQRLENLASEVVEWRKHKRGIINMIKKVWPNDVPQAQGHYLVNLADKPVKMSVDGVERYRWKYGGARMIWVAADEELIADPAFPLDYYNPDTNPIYNLTEHGNPGDVSIFGPGPVIVHPGININGLSYPPGFLPRPIFVGTTVPVWEIPNSDGTMFNYTFVTNAHDGNCEAPPPPDPS